MSRGLVGAQGRWPGRDQWKQRMQRLEGCAPSIWTLSCECGEPLKGSGLENDMHWRGELTNQACTTYRGNWGIWRWESSILKKHYRRPFLILQPPSCYFLSFSPPVVALGLVQASSPFASVPSAHACDWRGCYASVTFGSAAAPGGRAGRPYPEMLFKASRVMPAASDSYFYLRASQPITVN